MLFIYTLHQNWCCMFIYGHYPKNGVMSKQQVEKRELFERIKVISNPLRFRILELTEIEQLSIRELSSKLELAYNKCADYVRMMEQKGLIQKTREGQEVKVRSKVKIYPDKIEESTVHRYCYSAC